MSKKYIFNPDVPGEYGDNSIFDDRFYPSKIYHVDYLFDRHPDDIFQNGRSFFLLDSLYNKIIDLGFTGIDNPRLITYKMNPQFYYNTPNEEIPTQNYYFVDVIGTPKDDIYFELDPKFEFFVTERMMLLMKKFRTDFVEFKEFK